MRLRAGLRRHGGPKTSRREVPPDAAPGGRGNGRGLPGARPASGTRRGDQDPDGAVPRPPDGATTGSLGHVGGDSSGVAQIYGVEFWRGRPFLVVEFLAGGTLADRLRDGPFAPAEAVSVVARLAGALAALHEKGFLHGDIKPSNIGFTSERSPKLLDFGLAHAVDDNAIVGGTLPYLSPEVLTGRAAGEADDVWSLSVVLYEMVSGRHPFSGGTLEEVQRRIRRQRLAAGGPAESAAPTPAPAVAAFAASILTAPREGRPGTAPAFAAALAKVPGNA